MGRWIAEGRTLDDDLMDDIEADKVVMYLLDFYEFTCEGAFRGVVDKDLLDQESGGRMERAYFVVKNYVAARDARLSKNNAAIGLPSVEIYQYLKIFLRETRKVEIP